MAIGKISASMLARLVEERLDKAEGKPPPEPKTDGGISQGPVPGDMPMVMPQPMRPQIQQIHMPRRMDPCRPPPNNSGPAAPNNQIYRSPYRPQLARPQNYPPQPFQPMPPNNRVVQGPPRQQAPAPPQQGISPPVFPHHFMMRKRLMQR